MSLMAMADQTWFPDFIYRYAIRMLSRKRLKQESYDDPQVAMHKYQSLIEELKKSMVAVDVDKANEQHYELPAIFFEKVLGKNLKYSSAYFEPGNISDLDKAENEALRLSASRAELQDGMNILELGCGWGSLTVYMAKNFPNAKITAVSNSHSQREYIQKRLEKAGLHNVNIITQDINELSLDESQFDRVVSIEMFEHVRNYQALFGKVSSWLKDDGKLWCHIFCHRNLMYKFEQQSEYDWMSKYFFTGGIMPAFDTFLSFQENMLIEKRWYWSGRHYEKTSNAWLKNMDMHEEFLLPHFKKVYGDEYKVWWHRWRLFFMSCAELFGLEQGKQWGVGHYLFAKR